MSERWFVFLVVCCVVGALGAGELPVNVRTTANQCNASVAVCTDGRFIVVWSSYYSGSGQSNDILARWFDPAGQPATDEFRVNSVREGNQTCPSVATDSQGHALVAWQGPGPDGREAIFARVLDANGVGLTDETCLSSATEGRQLNPSVAAGRSGTVLVVWESVGTDAGGERTAVSGQLLDALGAPRGPEFSVDDGQWQCRYPDVAMDAAGNFAVAWLQDRSDNAVLWRLFDPNGLALTEPAQVNTEGISSITCPSIAMSPSGHIVVAWDGDPNLASADQIHARLFDPNGRPKAEPFIVNSTAPGPHQWPQVAIGQANEFVVVWQSESADPNLAGDVYARRFNQAGDPMEEPFLLSDTGSDKQRYPDVAMTPRGSFVAVWESDQQPGSDYDVYARAEPVLLTTDFTSDGVVDFFDFRVLGWSWRMPSEIDATSCSVAELRAFCNEWLQ